MFEKELYNYISEKFKLEGFPLSFGFGEIGGETKAPYIIMFPLNNNGTKQVLCNNNDYTDGESVIQFSIYAADYSNALYIGRELDKFLADTAELDNYTVLLNNSQGARGFQGVNTALSLETVTRYFTYTKKYKGE